MEVRRSPRPRVFFGFPLDHAVRAPVAAIGAALAAASRGRAVDRDNLHATLVFLGTVAREEVRHLRDIAGAAALPPFDLALDTTGSFRRAQVAWIAPSRLPDALAGLHRAMSEALHAAGFAFDDRAYRPHVTLARHCRVVLPDAAVTPIAWPVRQLALFESVSGTAGPRYLSLAQWPLSA